MNTKIKLLLTFLSAVFVFAGCNNGSTTTTDKDTASTKMINTKNDTIINTLNTDRMKRSDSLLFVINKMMDKLSSMKISGDVDIHFANKMIVYHQGTIDMSLQEIKSGTDEGIKAMAKEIVRNQMDQQTKLGGIAKNSKTMKTNLRAQDESSNEVAQIQGIIDSMKWSGDIDKDFVRIMISHLEGEIRIAKNEFSFGINTELKQIAQKIMSEDTRESSVFKNWLSASK